MEKLFGLIGFPLSHSFSAGYFARKFEKENITHCKYTPFPLEKISSFPDLLQQNHNLVGLNVTIPYKEAIIPYLDELSESAREVGAVNTIKISRHENKIYTKGFNTDIHGFEQSLLHHNINLPANALILGTGGASKATEWVLKKHGCEITFVSRKPAKQNTISWEELNKGSLKGFNLIINSTPLGMYPNIHELPPLPYDTAHNNQTFFDLIYNPAETAFMKKGKDRGCKIINGLLMLEQQAEKAWEIWTNAPKL